MKGSRKEIYPAYPRINVYATTYAKISMDNHYRAQQLYDAIVAAGYNEIDLPEGTHSCFCDSVIISVVFSAMAIEAFINDYGASCIGDDLYYGNFDYLSVFGKLQLIAEFLMDTKIDKGQSYYSHLKTVFSSRDKLVHSKSQLFDTENISQSSERISDTDKGLLLLDKEDVKKDMELSDIAIKAMRDVAYFFDSHDSNVYAFFRLMGLFSTSNHDTVITKFIRKKFNIKENY